MTRLEKITFIKSYWTYKNVYEQLDDYSDQLLDSIINDIILEMRHQTSRTAIDHVLNTPVYLN